MIEEVAVRGRRQGPSAPLALRAGVEFNLHGMACHICGRPATRWSSGVTLPCGCGQERGEERGRAR